MFSYYLQGRSYYYANKEEVIAHLCALNKIIANQNEYDHFYKSMNFENFRFDKWSSIGSFFNSTELPKSLRERVLPSILKRFKVINESYMSVTDMNVDYRNTSNAFLCAKTLRPAVSVIVDYSDYIDFKAFMTLQTVGQANFQKCCNIMFKRVIITTDACAMVRPLGKFIKQVFGQLIVLDEYIQKAWTNGTFNEGNVAANTSLDITDESTTVKQNPSYNQYRRFRIPGIGSKYCFIHIKTGALRFHIYPDNVNRVVYIPYIGKHLPTPSDP